MRIRSGRALAGMLLLTVNAVVPALALDADDLEDIVGFTAVASSNVVGDCEGADFDETVSLDNGMIFEFNVYSYSYSYRPTVIVFAMTMTPEYLRKRGVPNAPPRPITIYKLVIDDELYDVSRVR